MENNPKNQTTLFNYGNNEDGIGFNFFFLENTNLKGEAEGIIIDAGSQFPSNKLKNISNLILDISPYLKKANAIFLTHGHMDHLASLAHMVRLGHKLPTVHGTVYTLANFEAMLSKLGVQHHDFPKVKIIGPDRNQAYSRTVMGAIEVEAHPSSHSIPGAVSLFVKVKKEKVGEKDLNLYFSGDGRLNPAHVGYETDLNALRERFEKGIDFMFLDSTSTVAEKMPVTEAEITQDTARILTENHGKKIIMSMISNNIPRMKSLMIAAGVSGYKNIDIRGYSAVQAWKNLQLTSQHDEKYDIISEVNQTLRGLGHSHEVKVFTNKEGEFNPTDTIIFTTGVNGEKNAGLDRAANEEHPDILIDSNTLVMLSQRVIPTPGNQELRDHLVARIKNLGGNVIETWHASGHSSKPETVRFINAVTKGVSRKSFIGVPIHGNKDHLAATTELLKEMDIDSFSMKSGDIVSLNTGSAKVIGHNELNIMAIKTEYLEKKESEDTYMSTRIENGEIAVNYNDVIAIKQATMEPYHPSKTLSTFASGAKAKMTRDENIAMRRRQEREKDKAQQNASNKRAIAINYSERKQEIAKAQSDVSKAEKKENHARKEAKKAKEAHKKVIAGLKANLENVKVNLDILVIDKVTDEKQIADAKKQIEIAEKMLKEAENKKLPAIEKFIMATKEKEEKAEILENLKLGKDENQNLSAPKEKAILAPGVIPQQVAAKERKQQAAKMEEEKRAIAREQEASRIENRAQKKQRQHDEKQSAIEAANKKRYEEKLEAARRNAIKMAEEALQVAIKNKQDAEAELAKITAERELEAQNMEKLSEKQRADAAENLAFLDELCSLAEKDVKEAQALMIMCAKKSSEIGKSMHQDRKNPKHKTMEKAAVTTKQQERS